MRRAAWLVMSVVAMSLSAAGPAQGQVLPLAADSAALLPAGTLRIGFGGFHGIARDRYVDGRLEGLGGPLTTPALGPSQFSLLTTVEQQVRGLGLPDFAASLGAARLDARQRLYITPLSIEYGATSRLAFGVSTSLVRTRAEVNFRIDSAGGRTTLGRNPIALGSGVAAANAATVAAYENAALNLQARRDDCIANAGSAPECPTILAEATAVSALIGLTGDFAARLAGLYGTTTGGGAPYVPLAGSAAEGGLLARVDSLRDALVRYGVTDVSPTTGLPLGAQTPLSGEDLALLVGDPVAGFGAKRLEKGGLIALGDVHFTASYLVLDRLGCGSDTTCVTPTRGVRQTVRLGYDLSTGARRRADRPLDQGTGSGFDALSVTSLTDVALNRWLSGSIVLGVTTYLGDDVRMRVPSVATPNFLEAWRDAIVPVTPGTRIDLGVAPHVRINEQFVVGLQWQWRQQAAGRYAIDSTTTDPLGRAVALDGRALEALSAWSEQRMGVSASYSMLPAIARGLQRLPVDISYAHTQTVFGHSGVVTKWWEDRIIVRYYARLFDR